MKNFRLFYFLAFLTLSIVVIYSCSKDNSPISSSKLPESATTEDRTSNVYPSSDYVMWQIKDKPYSVIFTSSGTNNHIWIVQKENNFTSETIVQITGGILGFYNQAYLKLSYGNDEYVYALASGLYQNYPANAVGLSKVIDDNLLNSLRNLSLATKGGVIDDVSEKATCKKDGESAKPCKCAGGENSTSCECSGSFGTLMYHEATSCKTGYFACCSGL